MVLNGDIKTLKEFKEYKELLQTENDKPINAEIVVDIKTLTKKVKTLNSTKKHINEKIEALPEERMEEIYKTIEKFEKKIEELLK